jgi:hypothetical protein
MLTSPHDSSNMSGSGVAYATPEYILYSGTLARAVMLKMRLLAQRQPLALRDGSLNGTTALR